MRYLHTMVRITDLDAALDFYVTKFGLVETRRIESEKGRFTLSPLSSQRNPKGGIWPHPVVSHWKLYLRDQEIIYCFNVKA